MFFDKNDIQAWSTEMKEYDQLRKITNQPKIEWQKPLTYKDVKANEIKFHPILQRYSDMETEKSVNNKEKLVYEAFSSKKQSIANQYTQDINIINFEKNNYGKVHSEEKIKPHMIPGYQIDYNIINNEKFHEDHYKNSKFNASNYFKKKEKIKMNKDNRDFNIISNDFKQNHQERFETEELALRKDIQKRLTESCDFNPVTVQFYDRDKEEIFLKKQEEEKYKHGKNIENKLPPSMRYREPIVFHEKDITEATRMLDEKKKNSKKNFELRYKFEKEITENDYPDQLMDSLRRMNRMNPRKYYEEMEKGFDTITLGESKLELYKKYTRPVYSNWDSLVMNSNKGSNLLSSSSLNLNQLNTTTTLQTENSLKENSQSLDLTSTKNLSHRSLKNTRSTKPLALSITPHINNNHPSTELDFSSNKQMTTQEKSITRQMNTNTNTNMKTNLTLESKNSPSPKNAHAADCYNKYCIKPKFPNLEYEHTRSLPPLASSKSEPKFNFKLLYTSGFRLN